MRINCIAQGTLLNTVVTQMGRRSKKEWIYVYMWLMRFAVHNTVEQLYSHLKKLSLDCPP